jgi:hypothetical protein
MYSMRRISQILFIALLALAGHQLWAQTEYLDEAALDAVFDEPSQDDAESVVEEEQALVDIVRGSRVTLGGDFSFNLGYTAGWTQVPWLVSTDTGDGSIGGFRHGALTDTRSALNLDFRIAPIFRVFLTFKFDFPTFRSEVSEFFADYTLMDSVFFRVGRHNLTWGISRFYPHTNLTARLPDAFPVTPADYTDELNDADSYAFRMTVPVGAGGVEFVGFTRNGFMADPSTPKAEDIGWGGNFNVAVPYLDFTIGTFYQSLMDWRSYVSAGTTLFDRLEFFSEGLTSYDLDAGDIRWGVNAGYLLGFWNNRFQFSGEYYYTTEDRDLRVKGVEYPLIEGHNIASGLAFYTSDRQFNAYTQVQYNVDENTGLVIPALTFDGIPYVTITAATPVIFGDENGSYWVNNPSENLDRALSFVIMAYLKAGF